MSEEVKDVATPRPTLSALVANLANAAWSSGTDEYREGVSDAACIRRGNDMSAARNALELELNRRELAMLKMADTLKYLKRHVAAQDVECVEAALTAYESVTNPAGEGE